MKSEQKLNDITSDISLKTIFSFLDYEYILKLTKYNKELQNKLGFKKENYENLINYEYTIRKIVSRIKQINTAELEQIISFISLVTFSLFSFIFIVATILYFKSPFNELNLINNYDVNNLNIINKINLGLFLLGFIILIAYFTIVHFIINNFYFDVGKIIYIKLAIIIAIDLFYIFFEVLLFWKIILSNKIKNHFSWPMVFDYILLVLLLLFIILMIFATLKYYWWAGTGIWKFEGVLLNRYKNIEIKNFVFPKTFLNLSKKEKIKCLKSKENEYTHSFSEKQKKIMEKINEYRLRNNSNSLYHEDNEKVPICLLRGISEEKLFGYKHSFKLGDKKYLLKYKKNTFEKNLNENKVDLDIMLNRNVNKMSITDIGEYQYIILSDDIDALFSLNFDDIEKNSKLRELQNTYDFNIEDSAHVD